MPRVGFRPLNTSLINADIGTAAFRSIDPDVVARRVFARIDDPAAKASIATNYVEALAIWIGEPGTPEEFTQAKDALIARLTQSLSAAYENEEPLRAYPPLPMVIVDSAPAPLGEKPSIDDARKWVLSWNAATSNPSDEIRTALSGEPSFENPTAEATAYERALLACDADLNEQTIAALAATPVNPPPIERPALPDGPATGSAKINAGDPMGVRATIIRNVYTASIQSPVLDPFLDRDEEIAVATLEELQVLQPTNIAVSYEHSEPRQRVPVLLVNGPFDTTGITSAIDEWRKTQMPPDGEFIFDVTAARLRLRRVVVRQTEATASTPAA